MRALPFSLFLALGGMLVAACGGEDTETTDVESTCCFNGEFFECSDAENRDCTDPSHDCDRDSSRDDECSF